MPATMTKAEQDQALIDNMGLVYMFANRIMRKRNIPDQYKEDVVQEGVLGMMKALSKYDSSIGKLSTYAFWWIRIFVNRSIRTLSDRYSATVEEYEDEGVEGDPAEQEDVMLVAQCDAHLQRLPPKLEVLVRRRMEGETLKAIGQDWRVSRERVRQLEATAHQRLRELVFPRPGGQAVDNVASLRREPPRTHPRRNGCPALSRRRCEAQADRHHRDAAAGRG